MSESPPPPSLSVIVVTFNSGEEIARSLPPLCGELRGGDELIVVDNRSSDDTCALVRRLCPDARLVEQSKNTGFGAAVNVGAAAASGDLLLILNPDAAVAPGFRDAIELPWLERRGWDSWQPLISAEQGRVVNAWGGVVHFTAIAWAGGAARPIEEAPTQPTEVTFASGAALVVTATAWRQLGGFSADYFLYHEDTELGLRLWLGGYRVGLEPRARVDHDYRFEKGSQKWYFLERNRWATIVRTYPTRLLVALVPALAATELALLAVALIGGWGADKLRADRDALRALPRLRRERNEIRAVGAPGPLGAPDPARFAALLTAKLDSEFLGAGARSRPVAALLASYWRAVLFLLGG